MSDRGGKEHNLIASLRADASGSEGGSGGILG